MKTETIKMQAGGVRKSIYITQEIRADWQEFDWASWNWKDVESDTSQRHFVAELAGLTAADSVDLYINSLGGEVKEALGIFNVIQRCPAAVTAYIDGFAASAASVIAMAADKVIMPRNTAMMIHNAAWCAYGNPAELRKSADDLEVINTAAIQSYAMHAGDKLPEAELRKMLDAETWLTAEECVMYGLADGFADQDADPEAVGRQFRAAAQAGKADARMINSAPAFMRKPVKAQNEGDPAPGADNHTSSLETLLKNFITTEEN